MKNSPSKIDLINEAKTYWGARGFKKQSNRWIKETDDLRFIFYVQSSQWSSEDYYIRPGVFIKKLLNTYPYDFYGDLAIEINPQKKKLKDIFDECEKFFAKYCDLERIKEFALKGKLEDVFSLQRGRKIIPFFNGIQLYEDSPKTKNLLVNKEELLIQAELFFKSRGFKKHRSVWIREKNELKYSFILDSISKTNYILSATISLAKTERFKVVGGNEEIDRLVSASHLQNKFPQDALTFMMDAVDKNIQDILETADKFFNMVDSIESLITFLKSDEKIKNTRLQVHESLKKNLRI